MKKTISMMAAVCAVMTLVSFNALAHEFTLGNLTIEHPWARASAGLAKTGAAYIRSITISGNSADRLISISTPVAKTASVHNNIMTNSVMKMVPVKAVEINPGTPTVLKPGGLHIMLMGLKHPLKKGESFPLTLVFEKSGEVEVSVKIGSIGEMGDKMIDTPMPDMHQMQDGHSQHSQ